MFHCYVHNWSSASDECPKCCVVITTSSDGTFTVTPPVAHTLILQSEYDALLAQLADYKAALEEIDVKLDAWLSQFPKEDYDNNLSRVCDSHDIARAVLKKYECLDPYHDKTSCSSKVYDECPQCKVRSK